MFSSRLSAEPADHIPCLSPGTPHWFRSEYPHARHRYSAGWWVAICRCRQSSLVPSARWGKLSTQFGR